MKIHPLLPLIPALPLSLADFHIMWGDTAGFGSDPVGIFGSILVPSSSYTCATMLGAHNYDEYNTHAARPGQAIAFMQFEYGVCDSATLDFYYVPERDEYDVYYAGGDGRVVGVCEFTRGSVKRCPVPFLSSVFYEEWECITDICGPA